jgi:hypothetical protein
MKHNTALKTNGDSLFQFEPFILTLKSKWCAMWIGVQLYFCFIAILFAKIIFLNRKS